MWDHYLGLIKETKYKLIPIDKMSVFNNAGLTNLESLNLDSCKVSDGGIEHIKGDTRPISTKFPFVNL